MLALVTNFVTIRLRRLPIGRAWEALREDEIACRSLGINTTNTKLTAFAMGAMFGGFAGSFFATRQGFISPESFSFTESAMILAIVVLGGMGSQVGVAVAAMVMIGGIELFREFATVPHADLRPCHGGDHGLAAARAGLDAHALDLPRKEHEVAAELVEEARVTTWEEAAACLTARPNRSSPSSICRCASAAWSRSTTCRSPRGAATSPR